MKKLLAFWMVWILLTGMIPVKAAETGEVIGVTRYTDIIASINDYNIASFNFND